MRKVSVLTLILLGVSGTHAQAPPDPLDPAMALPKAWAILTSGVAGGRGVEGTAAIMALATAGTPRALDLIERIAIDPEHSLRAPAIASLPDTASLLPTVARALDAANPETRRAAIEQLGRLRDPAALQLLQDVILRGDADVEHAIDSARRQGPLAFGVLLHVVRTGGERSRESAIRCIESLLHSYALADNVRSLREHQPEAILVRALDDRVSRVRVLAAMILARLGNPAGAAELVRVSQAPDPQLGMIFSRHYALAALQTLGRSGSLALLAAALNDPDARVRMDAALAMRAFPHPSMRDVWTAVWRGRGDQRYQAFIGLLATRDAADVALLRAGVRDRDVHIRLAAASQLLRSAADPESVAVLEELVAEPRTRLEALRLLGVSGDPARTAALARSLLAKTAGDLSRMRAGHLDDPGHALAAIHTLEVLQDRQGVATLGALFGADVAVNYRVVRALLAIGRTDAEAGRTLVRALASPHAAARIHAAGGVIRLYTP